jgi:hypothetical protein
VKTLEDIQEIIDHLSYVDRAGVQWTLPTYEDEEGIYLQVRFADTRNVGAEYWQTGRKWRLSKHMTDSEVVWTCFAAISMAEEHEMRENFRYRGACIAGPNLDVEVLAEVARYKKNMDLRPSITAPARRYYDPSNLSRP